MTLSSRTGKAPLQRRLPRVLAFSTPHCPNCRAIAPTVQALHDEYRDRVEFLPVVASAETAAVTRHRVRGVPTLIALDGDRELARHVGRGSEADLRRLFEAAAERRTASDRIPRTDRAIRTLTGAALLGIAIAAASLPLAAGGVALTLAGWWDLVRR